LHTWLLALCCLLTLSSLVAQESAGTAKRDFTIAWSRYPGWEPWGIAASSGILAKWAEREGLRITMSYVDSYPGSIEGFVSGRYDGCAMTNIDVVTGPLLKNLNTAVVVVGDYSAGNDGIVLRTGRDLAALATMPIHLVQDSVSHYLLYRASQSFGLEFGKLTVVDTDETALVDQFASGTAAAIATWNPHLANARRLPGATMAYDSSRIQGEILDLMAIRGDAPDGLRRALVGAWFETVGQLVSSDPAVRDGLLQALATQAGVTPAEMTEQLEATAMFFHAWDAAGYLRSPRHVDAWRKALEFAEARALIPNATDRRSPVRVEFPQGAALGGNAGTTVVIDDRFTRAAALGDLTAPR
jgi:NitT/TauT family transport system substrate-binding protein